MKKAIFCAMLIGASVTASASVFASGLSPEEIQATHVMAGSEQPVQVQQAPQDINAGPKTRAQVYQELVDAERSGVVEKLNATLYAN
ncbi:DUF4148 domain-containing protein [Pararobbsia alpina]|uniref:DUF4148 domain-containing protein n=1 Tax=Pararobbsia alpina TaxID=621374 RepID=UPI0039A43F25